MIMMYLQKLYIRRYQSQQNLRHIFPGIARWPLHCLLIILVWYYFMSSTLLFADDPLITQEIRYHTTETSEVFLVWGIDGWNVAPEEMRPTGTIVKAGHIHELTVQEGDTFVAKIPVSFPMMSDDGFLITQSHVDPIMKEKLMYTPMDRERNSFIARIQVPSAAILNYGFLIIKNREGVDLIRPG